MSYRVYKVGISKYYFPYIETFHDCYEVVRVRASSRTEAAKKAWSENGARWLQKMKPNTSRLGRKVSLHVNEPRAGVGGLLGRLATITVYKEEL